MRLFTAFALPPDVREEVLRRQAALEALPFRRWQSPETLHLTLHFLGEVEPALVEPLAQTLGNACAGAAPFRLQLGRLGAFPSPKRPRVLWIGVEGQVDRLLALEGVMRPRLLGLGIPLEARTYHPHITLARDPLGSVALPPTMAGHDAAREWQAAELTLFQSILRRTGAVHEVLATFPLSGPPPRAR